MIAPGYGVVIPFGVSITTRPASVEITIASLPAALGLLPASRHGVASLPWVFSAVLAVIRGELLPGAGQIWRAT